MSALGPRARPQIGRTRLARTRIARTAFGLGLSALVLGALALLPIHAARASAGRALRLVLVDVSASVVATRPSFALDAARVLRAAAAAARAAREDVGIVVFGDGARVACEPGPAEALEGLLAGRAGAAFDPERFFLAQGHPAGAEATDLAGALALAATLAHGRPATRIVVVGDGSWNGNDPAPLARLLQESGAVIEPQPVGPPERANAGIAALRAPARVERGAPLALECDLVLAGSVAPDRGGTALALELAWTVPGSARAARLCACAPPPGLAPDAAGALRWTARLEVPAPARDASAEAQGGAVVALEARVLPPQGASADADPRDDVARAAIVIGDDLVVGVHGSADLQAALLGTPAPGIAWHVLATTAGTAPLASEGPALDALVADELPPRALVESVLARGGGWLDLVSAASLPARLAPAGAGGTAELSALVPAPQGGPRDLVFLLDASGSMDGAPFEAVRGALERIVERAPAEDDLEARFFAAELSPRVVLGGGGERRDPGARARALSALLGARTPSGATALWGALESVATERERASRPALVFVLSDGRDPDRAALARRGAELRARFEAARARLVVVSAGTDADEELLGALCARAEDLLRAGDLAEARAAERLAALFEREILRERLRAEEQRVRAVPAPEPLAAEFARLLADRPAAELPRVEHYVRCAAAAGASVAWTDEQGEPMLAVDRRGRGLVAATAVDPAAGDAAARRARAELLQPIVRALARGSIRSSARARLVPGAVVLADLDERWPVRFPATLVLADGTRAVLDFLPEGSGPAAFARRRAELPASVLAAMHTALPTGLQAGGARLDFGGTPFAAAGGLPSLDLGPAPASETAEPARPFRAPYPAGGQPPDERGPHPSAPGLLLAALLLLAASGFASLWPAPVPNAE